MDFGNQSLVDEFIFTGFSIRLEMRILLFGGLLFAYVLTLLGNSFLIFTIITSLQLHTAMYYFLCNLSFIDLFFSSNSIPKILFDVFSKQRRISVLGCLTQMNFGLILGGTECVLLAVMAYDRYIAICFPLHYAVIMSWRVCRWITVIIWLVNLILVVTPTILKPLLFCRGNKLNHLSCEILVLLELACRDVSFYKLIIFVSSLFVLFLPFVFIVVSYICIIISILKIKTADGRSKAFSTCASHLTVVSLLYGTNMTTYIGQGKKYSANIKYISIIYGLVIPALNPFIYSLRNIEVKRAFWKMLTRYSSFKGT